MNEIKKILQINGGMNRGGAETMIMNIYREIDKKAVQFDFISYYNSEGDFDKEIKSMGGNLIRIKSPKEIGFFKYLKQIKLINQKYGPYHAMHAHTLFNSAIPLLCAKIIGIPNRICHAHNTSVKSANSIKGKIYRFIMRLIILMVSTKLIACGREAGNFVFGKGLSKRVTVLPNAIKLEKFENVSEDMIIKCKNDISANKDDLIIGSIAGFREQKNHVFMLKVVNEMKCRGYKFKMVFISKGHLFEEIKQKTIDLGLEDYVVFLGTRNDVPSLLHTFDVLFMPSLHEGLPVTLIESQAAGLAAVVSSNITDEVDLGLGLLSFVSLNDSVDLWISELIKCSKLKNSVSINIKKEKFFQRGYVIESSVQELMSIYEVQNNEKVVQ